MKEDLTGKHFGKLTVLEYNEETGKWICQCECENKTEVLGYNLKLGNTKSCGCLKNSVGTRRPKTTNVMGEKIGQLYVTDVNKTSGYATVKCLQCKRVLKMPIQELVDLKKTRKKSITCGMDGCKYISPKKKNGDIQNNTKFGKLTVIKRLNNKIVKTDKTETSIPMYLCKCDCGNNVEVQGRYLLDGRTKSCGCLRHRKNINKNQNIYKDLLSSLNNKKLYQVYLGWQQKYNNPTQLFKRKVIDKGIQFFPELKNEDRPFEKFFIWAKENGFHLEQKRIYLERRDYNQDFNMNNCYWTDKRTRGY